LIIPKLPEQEREWDTVIAANQRHDRAKHTVCMWPRAHYRGGFGYPPEREAGKRIKWIQDGEGRIKAVME